MSTLTPILMPPMTLSPSSVIFIGAAGHLTQHFTLHSTPSAAALTSFFQTENLPRLPDAKEEQKTDSLGWDKNRRLAHLKK
jgi:hypothetical protein